MMFTIAYMKHIMFCGFIMLQPFCNFSIWYIMLFPITTFLYFATYRSMCAVSNMAALCNLFLSFFPVLFLSEWFWNGSSYPYYFCIL
jgi:hypothetical protein